MEHCALEEFLTNNKTRSLSLLGKLCRLTARGALRSVNGVYQGYLMGEYSIQPQLDIAAEPVSVKGG